MDEIRMGNRVMQVTEKDKALLRATASSDRKEAEKHQMALAQVLGEAWRAGVLEPDIISDIFTRIPLAAGADAKFPFDFYTPARSAGSDFQAFIMPQEGHIPDRVIEGEEIYVPTFKLGNAISWSLDYARDARWDVVARAIEVYSNGFVQKLNDEGWHVLLAAANINTPVLDSNAANGVFTVNLITGMKVGMKRLTGGRNTRMTDIYLSPEAMADIQNLSAFQFVNDTGTDQTGNFGYMKGPDDMTLRQLLMSPTEGVPTLFGVRFHELYELGVSQEYQTYVVTTLGNAMTGSKQEYCVGFDLAHRDSFLMPVREDMQMFDDPTLHRAARAGVYGWMEVGFAALDSRRCLLGEL